MMDHVRRDRCVDNVDSVESADCLDCQVYAVRKALSNPLCLIQGPPGVIGCDWCVSVCVLSQIFLLE